MARDPAKLSDRPWTDDVEIARADVTDAEAVRRALQDVDLAYYLIHSLGTGPSFEQKDRDAASLFARAASEAGVRRIVYLGGIVSGPAGSCLRTCAPGARWATSCCAAGCRPSRCRPR